MRGIRRRIAWLRVNHATWRMRRVLAILEGIDQHPDRPDVYVDLVPDALRLLREALDALDPELP